MNPLFSPFFLEKRLYKAIIIGTKKIETKKKGKTVKGWITSISNSNKKEKGIKSSFINMLFKDILGYTMYGNTKEYNLLEEYHIPNSG